MGEKIDEFLLRQTSAIAEVREGLAAVQRDNHHNAMRHQETAEALKSMAESLSKLAVVAERLEDVRDDVRDLKKSVHSDGGLDDKMAGLDQRMKTLELWIGGVKFIVSPALGAIIIKEALRLWN